MQRYLVFAALAFAAVAGCGRSGSGGGSAITPPPPDLPGVYAGSAPCLNCKEIAATLWLRGDKRFFLRQRYLGDDGAAADASYAFGRWTWDETAAELVLRSGGPERHFKRLDGERLELASLSAPRPVFTRDHRAPVFRDHVRLEGESVVTEHAATFRQCVTELGLPIVNNDGLKELRRLHGSLNPTHKVALTELDGHIVAVATGGATSEQLVIDKVIDIKPGTGC